MSMTTWSERAERLCTNWQTVQIGRTVLTLYGPVGWFFRIKDSNGAVLSEALSPDLDQSAKLAEDSLKPSMTTEQLPTAD